MYCRISMDYSMVYELLQLLCRHYVHSSTIAQHFGHAWSNFSGIITHTNNRVRSYLLSVLDHDLVGVPARLLAKFGVERVINLAPSNCLYSSIEILFSCM